MNLGVGHNAVEVAIIGSGPSGFYAAEALLRRHSNFVIDMFERLPTPFGLVRGGVAPDHPKIKQVSLVYDRIARSPRFAFFGNIEVGYSPTIEQLRSNYHVVILACGSSTNKRLGITGEDLPGSHTAAEFVGWYNGQPDYRDRVFDFSGDNAVIIGHGNVAADVARILATPVDHLRRTDIAEHALTALARSRIRNISIIGRRGPAQMKVTTSELKELTQIRGCTTALNAQDLELDPTCAAEIADPRGDEAKKNVTYLHSIAAATGDGRAIRFRFRETPIRINGFDRVSSITLAKNLLEGPPFGQSAVATSQTTDLSCDLIFNSAGYMCNSMPGVDFDEQAGTVLNHKGRCLRGGEQIPGLYVTGWMKRGPTGVIGTNRADSLETVESILTDLANVPMPPKAGSAGLGSLFPASGKRIVNYADWDKIDLAERSRGQDRGKPREKFTDVSDMILIVDGKPA